MASAKPAFDLKVGEGLGGQREQFRTPVARAAVLHELNQLAPDALVLVRRADVQARELALVLLGKDVQRDTGDRVPVDLEDVVVVDVLLDRRPRPPHQFIGLHGLPA